MKNIILLILSITLLLLSQEQNELDFYPLKKGNYFEYLHVSQQLPYPPDISIYAHEVIGDTTLDNNKNYKIIKITRMMPFGSSYLRFDRIDSTTGSVFRYNKSLFSESSEFKVDSLFAQAGDTINCSHDGLSSSNSFQTICLSVQSDTILGMPTTVKEFVNQSSIPSQNYKLAEGLGLIYEFACEFGCGSTTLIYAKVDGKEYGTRYEINNNYYPLEVGNRWVYKSQGFYTENIEGAILVYPWDSQLSIEVVDTVSSNEKVFELLITKKNIFSGNFETMTWYETYYDGCEVYSSYSPLYLFNDYEKRFDSCSLPGDSAQFKFFDYRFNNEQITLHHFADSTINLFEEITTVQNFEKVDEQNIYDIKLAHRFGLIEQHGEAKDSSWESHLTLKGAVIDGVVYGDTSLVVSVEEEEDLLNTFALSQNYPNPFNPTTKIKFTLPSPLQGEGPGVRSVKLIVYDILGREIKTLLNKLMRPGEYEVTFDGTDLPSGVYFYRLNTDQFSVTRKMILIK